jgi:hypothetical protein
MAVHEITTKDGRIEKVFIPGSEDMSHSQLQEILEWSKENSDKREVERKQKAKYRKIPAIEAYQEMKRFKAWLNGKGRIF